MLGDMKGKATALVLVLVLSLTALGVAYGLWSEALTIQGTVNTGDLDAVWTGASCDEFFDWPWPPEGDGEVGGKDVGSTTWTPDPVDPQILHFTINNGYPSYAVDCEVEYTNTGTIPWVVEDISIVPGPNLTNCTLIVSPSGSGSQELRCDQLTITYVDGLCEQIDPGDPFGLASSLRVHVEQPATQNATYTFDVEVLLVQWNESNCP